MADRVISRDEGVPSTFGTLYKDIGSGAYAPVVATVAAGVSPVPSAITPTHTVASVNGNTLALAANDARVYALLINDSDTVIYLNFGGAAAVNTGIRLNASGGSYEMSPAFRNVYLGAIYANHGGGAVVKKLLVTEGV